jgi:hypothetical protein
MWIIMRFADPNDGQELLIDVSKVRYFRRSTVWENATTLHFDDKDALDVKVIFEDVVLMIGQMTAGD